MAIKKDINNYTPNAEDVFFIDSNIWIYLLDINCIVESSKANDKKVEKYSTFIEKLKENNIEIVLLSMSISEIYNIYIRNLSKRYYDLNGIQYSENRFKKIYRPSRQFNNDNKFIINNIKNNILPLVKVVNDNFDDLDINKVLNTRADYDFNDNYYMRFCEKNNYKILTNDKDFINNYDDINVEVYTII